MTEEKPDADNVEPDFGKVRQHLEADDEPPARVVAWRQTLRHRRAYEEAMREQRERGE